ncbi:MAG TPA: EAL domain-containing protein [Streptosporangiaceae bacterium]
MKDPNNTRNTVPRRGSPLWIYFVSVIGVGVLAFALALSRQSSNDLNAVFKSPVFWLLAGFIVLGELRPIMTPGSHETNAATVSTLFTFATLLYAGLPLAAILQAIAEVAAGMLHRRAAHRTAFNVAQLAISLTAATLVLMAFGISGRPTDPWVPTGHDLVPFALAAATYFVVNNVLVNEAVALHERIPLAKALRLDLGRQVLTNLALLGLAPIVVVAMAYSAALVPLIVLPFIAVYVNASASMRREHQALHDSLTGLPNRKLLTTRTEDALDEARRRAPRGADGRVEGCADGGSGGRAGARADGGDARAAGRRVGLFLLDLDRFKEVNDTLGHATGDRLLRIVAYRLVHSVRPGDLVARLGGDEFAVLLPNVRDAQGAKEVAARLRAALNEPVRLEGTSFDLEASVGIALCPDHALDFESLLQRADVAMYVAKESRSGVEVYTADKDRNSPERLTMLGDLRRAVDREELQLHFQPKIALLDGRLVGMEGLLRWRHPLHGLLAPDDFLRMAEQTYLMRSITHFVVDAALAQAAQWWRAGLAVQVAVNVSGRDLFDTTLTETIATGLVKHDVPARLLQLEITERLLTAEPAYASDTIDAIAKLGVPLSLDDFGTGYSSLVRLKRLPVEEIKIDASFIGRIGESADDAVIVRSIVDLVRTLGLRSVAEGVEDAQTAQVLRDMGCESAQGWYFGRPMDADAATAWLRSQLEPEPMIS